MDPRITAEMTAARIVAASVLESALAITFPLRSRIPSDSDPANGSARRAV